MSSDVIIFNSKIAIQNIDDLPEDFVGSEMGTADEIRRNINAVFPGTDWSDPSWGIFDGDGFSIEFNIGNEAITTDLMLHVRGNGDPVTPIVKLCRAYSWKGLDTSTGELLNADNPSSKGWRSFYHVS